MRAAHPAIVLAGGRSERAGTLKGLITLEGDDTPWLARQVRALREAGVGDVVVVLGHRADEYRAALPWLVDAESYAAQSSAVEGARVPFVMNPAPERGPFLSVQAGARWALSGGADAAWVLPVDVPCAGVGVFAALASRLADPVLACVPTYEGAGGHPVLLGRTVLARLCAIDPGRDDARLDAQLRALADADAVARVPVGDASVRANLNTREDWLRLRPR